MVGQQLIVRGRIRVLPGVGEAMSLRYQTSVHDVDHSYVDQRVHPIVGQTVGTKVKALSVGLNIQEEVGPGRGVRKLLNIGRVNAYWGDRSGHYTIPTVLSGLWAHFA